MGIDVECFVRKFVSLPPFSLPLFFPLCSPSYHCLPSILSIPILFIDPPPKSLICPMCLGVLEDPVACPNEHLFCSEELLEWLLCGSTCPADNLPLDPESVTRPGRIVLNLLGELERYCPQRQRGCSWTGQQDSLEAHLRECSYERGEDSGRKVERLQTKVQQLQRDNAVLRGRLEAKDREIQQLERRLVSKLGALRRNHSYAQDEEEMEECLLKFGATRRSHRYTQDEEEVEEDKRVTRAELEESLLKFGVSRLSHSYMQDEEEVEEDSRVIRAQLQE
ncbi:unnamed protein product, partial [Chrysoparadoxa australica]